MFSISLTLQRLLRPALMLVSTGLVMAPTLGAAQDFCPDVYDRGKLGPLNINPAFTHIDSMNAPNGSSYDGLIVSSFYNAIKNPNGAGGAIGYFEPDQVVRITGIGYRWPAWFDKDRDVEVLSDQDLASPTLPNAPGQVIWPNEAQKVPDGILPFEAIVVPEGFHTTAPPGGITIINLDDPNRETYEVTRSPQDTTNGFACKPPNAPNHNPDVQPRFYHLVKWWDMDGDGLKDAVSVRSGAKVNGVFCLDGVGEVVWFKNPGAALDPNTHWEEHVIAGFPTTTNAADISLDIADLEGDGVPEIVGGNFFGAPVTGDEVTLYGAPVGQSWTVVDPVTNPARYAAISTGNDWTFGVRFVDLNRDGLLDVLATNHQSDNCTANTADAIPGRVFALEQPASGDIFNDPWTQHTLKDGIRPNLSWPQPAGYPGRLAPGLAQEFWRTPFRQMFDKPWVLVGGDEASKVWLLKPQSEDPNDWNYDSSVIFDINDYYGPNTSQTFTAPPPAVGVSISTIGGVSWRYDRAWTWGSYAEIYIPVFEARDIHRISFRPGNPADKVVCPADTFVGCPAP